MNNWFFIVYLLLAFVAVFDGARKVLYSMRMIRRGVPCVQYFVYLLFFFFFIFPMVINIVYLDYHYIIFWRADAAMHDYFSLSLYAIFVITFSHFVIRSSKKDSKIVHDRYEVNPGIVNVCTVVMISCLVITILVSGIEVLTGGYGYAYINKDLNVNEAVIGCGVISYLIVLAHYRMVSKRRILLLTLIVFCFFWIVGKRYIIAETFMMCVAVMGMVGVMKGKTMIKYITIGGASLVVLGFLYGVFFKENVTSILDYLNVDFSRQYTLVYQFYCDRIGRQISINRFDGIIFLVTFFIPRFMWVDKPYPFVNNLTLSLVGQDDVEFVNAGWATTCSIFSDLYDSFWYFGLVIGIYLLVKLFHKANAEKRVHYKVILIYFCVKLLTVQISSSIVQITVVIIILLISSAFTNNRLVTANFNRIKLIKKQHNVAK